MATSGYTTTGALSDSLPVIIAAARIVRENEGVMPQLVDKQTLDEATGLTWNEVTLAQLTAQAVTETTELDNPQQVSDTNFAVTPTVIGIHTVLTDRVKRRLTAKAYVRIGDLTQNAIQRKKDEDGLVALDGAGTSLCGAGNTLTSGIIAAAAVRITSNATEPGKPPIRCVLHGYQIADLYTELTAALGTYAIPEGETARVFREGFRGRIHGAEIYEDGNITISGTDAKGGVFAQEGVVLVQGKRPWTETRREPQLGGGADSLFVYDEYAYGERLAGGSTSAWLYEIYSDATTPTS